jgi:dihydroorotase
MTVLIKQATIFSSTSPFNGQVKDILISEGIITRIADTITAGAEKVITADNLSVSTGWVDIFSNFCDPGYEYKESIESGAMAAAAGGFTDVMVLPNTSPVADNKSYIEYIVQKAGGLAVNILPIGAITKHTEGKELAELYDMKHSGAIAFSDGTNPVQNAGLMLKALQYVKSFSGTLIQIPHDKSIGTNGLMNEGIISTQLGLPGLPAIAEELMIARDIDLLRYTGSRLHLTGISTRKGIALIAAAKKEGLQITCSVTPYHLSFCDEDLMGYDTNLKVNPPLRSRADMEGLQDAVKNGMIDCFAAHHLPQDTDNKVCEFEYAKNGMTGLESLFSVVHSVGQDKWTLAQEIEMLSIAPRKIFGLNIPEIEENNAACLTLFCNEEEITFDASCIKSKSKNTPYIGKKMKGKVIGIINKNKMELNA